MKKKLLVKTSESLRPPRIALGLSISSWKLLQRLKNSQYVDQIALTKGAASTFNELPKHLLVDSASEILQSYWSKGGLFIVVGAVGAVTRLIAPLLKGKADDPAVIVLDANACHILPLLGGHRGGAESLAVELAANLGGNAVITGNSTIEEVLPIDSFGESWGWRRSGNEFDWQQLMLRQATGSKLIVVQSSGSLLWRNSLSASNSHLSYEKDDPLKGDFLSIGSKSSTRCCWHPQTLWVGIGCERGTSANLMRRAIDNALHDSCLGKEAIAGLASIDIKFDEPALRDLAKSECWPIRFFSAQELNEVSVPFPSARVKKAIGTSSVAEAAAILAAGQEGVLKTKKIIYQSKNDESGATTIAIAESMESFAPHRGELHLVGTGPGDLSLLTHDARSALSRSVVWIGYELYLDLLEPIRQSHQIRIDGKLTLERDRCSKAIDLAVQGARVALVSSGDSGIYGMAGLALELWLERKESERPAFKVHPGISAVQLAAARVGAPIMNDFCTISLSDYLTPWELIKERIRGAAIGDFVIAIYNPRSKDRDWQIEEALKILREIRSADTPVALARQLGRQGEKIDIFTLGNLPIERIDMLTLLLIGNSQSVFKDACFFTPRGY